VKASCGLVSIELFALLVFAVQFFQLLVELAHDFFLIFAWFSALVFRDFRREIYFAGVL
jgi:hypothetical protein